MPLRLSIQAANLMMDAIGNVVNSGKLRVYSGTQPASGNTGVTTQIKLVEFTLNVDAFNVTVAGVMTAKTIASANALATGKATWYRLVNAAGTTSYFDGSVGVAGSHATAILDIVDLTIGQVVSVTLLRYTLPLQA